MKKINNLMEWFNKETIAGIKKIDDYTKRAIAHGEPRDKIREKIGRLRDRNGNTSLHDLVVMEHQNPADQLRAIDILVDNGVDINSENNAGAKALDLCTTGWNPNPVIACKLLEKGAEVTTQMLRNAIMPFGGRSMNIGGDYDDNKEQVTKMLQKALSKQQREAFLDELGGIFDERYLVSVIQQFLPDSQLLSDKEFRDSLEQKKELFVKELSDVFDDLNLVKLMHDFVPVDKVSRKSKAQRDAELEKVMFDGAAAVGREARSHVVHGHASATHHTPRPPSPGRHR